MMEVKLTEEEQAKYDATYSRIISQYSKSDLKLLEEDNIAKHILKELILKYVFTGEIPDCSINNTTNTNEIIESHYDAKIPLEEKREDVKIEEPLVLAKQNDNQVVIDYDNLISDLKIERTESDNVDDNPIQNQ